MRLEILSLALALFALLGPVARADESRLEVREDGTALVRGIVVRHESGCEADGVCSLVLDVNGRAVFLEYAEGDVECASTAAVSSVSWGRNVEKGSLIEAYGAYSEQGSAAHLRFCSSQRFYIHTISAADRMDAGSAMRSTPK